MTQTQYRKHNAEWFRDKEATLSKTKRNRGGGIIEAGETVIIEGKSGRGGFCIRSKNNKVSISGVDFEDVNLK